MAAQSKNWRWQAGKPQDKLTKDSKHGKKAALAAWIIAYTPQLTAESLAEVTAAHAIMEEEGISQAQPALRPMRRRMPQPLEEPSNGPQLKVPDDLSCVQLLALSSSSLLQAAVVSQRRLPRSCFLAVAGALRDLYIYGESMKILVTAVLRGALRCG